MDFSVICPKPPTRKPDPPPKPPSPPPPPPFGGPPLPHEIAPPLGPYTEDHLDHAYRMQHLRSIEYTNARTWKMNFGHYSDNYGDYYYSHRPVRINGAHNQNDHQMLTGQPPSNHMALPPPDYHQTPPLLGLPPSDYHHAPPRLGLHPQDYHQAPPRLGLPQLDYHQGPPRHGLHPPDYHQGPPRHGLLPPDYHQGQPPVNYYYPRPYHGGFFSDENPNGCMVM